jgi:tripeptide aminopeptidase
MQENLVKRFLRYVKIDTQSQENVENQYPSTLKQLDLARLLVTELQELGLTDAALDEHGIVMATLPANLPPENAGKVPTLGFIAHLDTSPEVSGTNVNPQIIAAFDGKDIVLPGDPSVIITVAENPDLNQHVGKPIITSDGTTLLGADDKAGIAEIMTMLEYLQQHPAIKHGTIRIAFTPDEEVGAGTAHFDVKKFGANYAYTVDGESPGEIENETFSACSATFIIYGINVHPGYAKDKMVNALKIAAEIIQAIAAEPNPENTAGKEGYLHVHHLEGGVEKAVMRLLIRDFTTEGIEAKRLKLHQIRECLAQRYPRAQIELEIKEQYQNMLEVLKNYPQVVENALEAVRRTGLQPVLKAIRGGTDGAKLCFMGLPTPNIFAGGHNFHSKREWVAVADMVLATNTLLNLVQIWVEKSL